MLFFFNSNKMFFLFTLFFSTLISISSNSWLGCWIGLEVNLLSFIPLITNPINLLNSEASLKYFLTQSIASINFLFAIILNLFLMKNFFTNNFVSVLINSSLLMKMGSTPFHFWFPNIMEGLSWLNCFILMTWQKITPMILLSYYFNMNFLMSVMILNVLMGALGGFKQISLRKKMSFKSISYLHWMLSALLISENLSMGHIFLLTFLLSLSCFLFYMLNIFYLNQMKIIIIVTIMKNKKSNKKMKMKKNVWHSGTAAVKLLHSYLIFINLCNISFLFIMMSLIMLVFYIRIIYSSFMFFSFKFKWFKIFIKNNFLILINFFSFISLLGMIFSTLFFF
uniref:NADH dehydrogenase subunit 2 n=1 Tax=Paroeneis palaearcticus TaxID=1173053 RepID=UPI0021D52A8C|nr:NADH dehydrogenase subunit 2 [Paroeneis palaearcticus]UXD78923.1 NADH dehydrogenase subunit 2 [Paroeneis palaearcticus]